MGSKDSQKNEDQMKIVSYDESEKIIDPMAIKSVSEALQIFDDVMRFSQQHRNENLDQSLMTVTEKLQDMQISNRWQQKIRACSLVANDLRSETKNSRFESGCSLCAEMNSLQ